MTADVVAATPGVESESGGEDTNGRGAEQRPHTQPVAEKEDADKNGGLPPDKALLLNGHHNLNGIPSEENTTETTSDSAEVTSIEVADVTCGDTACEDTPSKNGLVNGEKLLWHQRKGRLFGQNGTGGSSIDRSMSEILHAEAIFEYQWPKEEGELWFIQEQIAQYLNSQSFKRRFPDIKRRPVTMEERLYLRSESVVTETQCDLGLTAVASDDLLQLLQRHYPDKYRELIHALHKREEQEKIALHSYSIETVAKNEVPRQLKRAVKMASEYNKRLNKERLDERRRYIDLNTWTVQSPQKRRVLPPQDNSSYEAYPVAVLPGQYTTHCRSFTPAELSRLPLKTQLIGRHLTQVSRPPPLDDFPVSEPSDDELLLGDEDDDIRDMLATNERLKAADLTSSASTPVAGVCVECGLPDSDSDFIHCGSCSRLGHPVCMKLGTANMSTAARSYNWQCLNCKLCEKCSRPEAEDQLILCDGCDRAFHDCCVGLATLPEGEWFCPHCDPRSFSQQSLSQPSLGAAPNFLLHDDFNRPSPKRRKPICGDGRVMSDEDEPAQVYICKWQVNAQTVCNLRFRTQWMLRKHKDIATHKVPLKAR